MKIETVKKEDNLVFAKDTNPGECYTLHNGANRDEIYMATNNDSRGRIMFVTIRDGKVVSFLPSETFKPAKLIQPAQFEIQI